MKIDFSKPLLALNGAALMTRESTGDTRNLTLKEAAIEALMSELDNERATGEQKFRRGLLAQRIYESNSAVEITVEEAALIKDRIGRGYPASVVLAAYGFLN